MWIILPYFNIKHIFLFMKNTPPKKRDWQIIEKIWVYNLYRDYVKKHRWISKEIEKIFKHFLHASIFYIFCLSPLHDCCIFWAKNVWLFGLSCEQRKLLFQLLLRGAHDILNKISDKHFRGTSCRQGGGFVYGFI